MKRRGMSEGVGLPRACLAEVRSAHPRAAEREVIGRGRESEIIEGCIGSVVQGRGAFLLIAGEPGIGKTTLAQIAEQRALALGLKVAWGRFREDRGAPPLWPWLQALRALGFDSEEKIRENAGAAAEDLWPMMSLSEAPETQAKGDAELSASRRFRLFEAVAVLLRSGRAPACVLLDDVHRADLASLDLLRHIGETIDLQTTFVMATFRHNELHDDHPLTTVLGSVAPQPSCVVQTLGPLDPDECRLHVQSLAGSTRLSPQVIEDVIDRSGGNPFFLEELARSELAGEPADNLPLTVREVILQRAEMLDEQTRATIQSLSVLGREFDIEDAKVLLHSEAGVPGLLEPGLQSGLLERSDGRIRFRHALVRDALYEVTPTELRRAHHERLATRPLSDRPSVDELTDRAHHSTAAAELGASIDVVEPALAAARAASTGVGHADAIHWFRRALNEDLGSDRIPVTLELADAYLRSGDHQSARATFELAFHLAQQAADGRLLAMAALGVGRCVVTAGPLDSDLITMLEQAEEALGEDHVSLRSRLIARRGVELYWHDGDRARLLTSEGVRLAQRSTSPRVRAEAMHARMFCLRGPGRLSERIALGTDLVDLAVAEGLMEDEFRGRVWLIPELLQASDLAAYRANIAALTDLAERTGHPLHLWYAYLYRAQQAITVGSYEDAIELAVSSLEHGRRAGAQVAVVYHIGQQYLIRRDRGDLESIADEMVDLAARFEVFPTLRALLSLLYTDIGRNEEAAAELARLAYQRFSAVPHDSLWIATLCICAEVSFRTRTAGTGALLASLLEPHAGTCAVQGLPTCFGAVDRYLALALAAAGRLDRARPHLERTVELHRQWGFVPFELRSELDLIRIDLPGIDSPAQIKTHLSRLGGIVERAKEAGYDRLADEAASLAADVKQHRPARLTGPGGKLSEREAEILARIAQGVTNRELAEQLTISINTVERHLRNIYTKLGVANRAEAAAAHVRHIGG